MSCFLCNLHVLYKLTFFWSGCNIQMPTAPVSEKKKKNKIMIKVNIQHESLVSQQDSSAQIKTGCKTTWISTMGLFFLSLNKHGKHTMSCRLDQQVTIIILIILYLVVLLQLLLVSWAGLLHHHSKVNVRLEDVYHLATHKYQHAVLAIKQGAITIIMNSLSSDTLAHYVYLFCNKFLLPLRITRQT